MVTLTSCLDERFATNEGYELLERDEALQDAVSQFLSAEVPERAIRVGKCIGYGRFSYTWLIGGAIVKISSATSSTDSYALRRPLVAEPLTNQFTYLGALGRHLRRRDATIVTPRQYFAVRSPHGAYLLCQQYMDGWMPVGKWIREVLLDQDWLFRDKNADSNDPRVLALERQVKERILRAVEGSKLRHGLNDLKLDGKRLHWGNIMVPQTTAPGEEPRLCIIDQPGWSREFRRQLVLANQQENSLTSTS